MTPAYYISVEYEYEMKYLFIYAGWETLSEETE